MQSVALETQSRRQEHPKCSVTNVLPPSGVGLARGGEGPAPGSRDSAPAWFLSTFPVTQCFLSSQTKKYADVIIPRGADNEGEWNQTLSLCPSSQLCAVAVAAELGRR